jgi:hypothetical protein
VLLLGVGLVGCRGTGGLTIESEDHGLLTVVAGDGTTSEFDLTKTQLYIGELTSRPAISAPRPTTPALSARSP